LLLLFEARVRFDWEGHSHDLIIEVTAKWGWSSTGDDAVDRVLTAAARRITRPPGAEHQKLHFAPGLWKFSWSENTTIEEIDPETVLEWQKSAVEKKSALFPPSARVLFPPTWT
jgi:hypothetical protein